MRWILTTGAAAAVGGLALSLTAGAGLAAADPIVDTTCTYEQVIAAANAQGPAAAAFIQSPQQQAGLRQFIDSSPAQRQPMAAKIRANPANAALLPTIENVFSSCSNF